MIKVGLTGGIGAGKSMVSKIFANLGVQIYDSDFQAKLLYLTDDSLKLELIKEFGEKVYTNEGYVNKKYLAEIVFNDKGRLDTLNHMIHPRVKIHFQNWINYLQEKPYIIKEAALLFDTGANYYMDRIIVVKAPMDIKIKRVMERDGVLRNEVIKRIQNQLPQEKIVEMANYLIVNDEVQPILPQVLCIHQDLLKLSGEQESIMPKY